MDPLKLAYYEVCFQVAFLECQGDAFQDLFSSIMEKRYPGDFVRVRPWGKLGDWKNDGYLPSQRILFQLYAPQEMRVDAAVKKIDEDFLGALPYWRNYFDSWIFVRNTKALNAPIVQKLAQLRTAHAPIHVGSWGREELGNVVRELHEHQLADLFGWAPSQDAVTKLGLAELRPILDAIKTLAEPGEDDLRPVPSTKLSYNGLSSHAAMLLRAGMTRVDLVRTYFNRHPDPTRRDRMAVAFKERYLELRAKDLSPDAIFVRLESWAAGNNIQLECWERSGLLAILAYFFEECDIFERPPEES